MTGTPAASRPPRPHHARGAPPAPEGDASGYRPRFGPGPMREQPLHVARTAVLRGAGAACSPKRWGPLTIAPSAATPLWRWLETLEAGHPVLVQKARLRTGLDQEQDHLPVLELHSERQGRAAPVVLERHVSGERPLDHVSVTAPDSPVKRGLPPQVRPLTSVPGVGTSPRPCARPATTARPGCRLRSAGGAVCAAGYEPLDHLPSAGLHRPGEGGVPAARAGVDAHLRLRQERRRDGDVPLRGSRVQGDDCAGDGWPRRICTALDEHLDHRSVTPTGRPRDRRPAEQVVGVGVHPRGRSIPGRATCCMCVRLC